MPQAYVDNRSETLRRYNLQVQGGQRLMTEWWDWTYYFHLDLGGRSVFIPLDAFTTWEH